MARVCGDRCSAATRNVSERASPEPRGAAAHGGGPEAPQRSAPPVAEGGVVAPIAVDGHPVVTSAVAVDRVHDEVEVQALEPVEDGRPVRFAAHDDQSPGDVVDTVSVRASWFGQQGVLEQPPLVAEPVQVIEGEGRPVARPHAATLAVISCVARASYSVGDRSPRQVRRRPGGGPGHLARPPRPA